MKETHIKTSLGWLSKTTVDEWKTIHEEYLKGKSLVELSKELKIRRTTLKEQFISLNLRIISKQESSDRRKKTCLDKYGVDHINKSKEVRKGTKQTCLEKYGVEYSLQSKEVIEKRIATCLEKYGETTNLKTELNKEKVRKTCLEKYGFENASKNKDIIEKRKDTCVIRYGETNPNKNRTVKTKANETVRKKYDIKVRESLLTNNYELMENYTKGKAYDENDNFITWTKYDIKHLTCGHIFKNDLHDIDNIKCGQCYPYQSSGELRLKQIVVELTSEEILTNSRGGLIPFKEIDIFIPSLNIALEYNGGYWHSMVHKSIYKNYHKNKTEQCLKKDIRLYHVWEYSNENIVKYIIKNKLGLADNKYFARKLKLKEVKIKDRRNFFCTNHLHGDVNASLSLGLYLDDELLQCISFRKHKEGIEIARLATKLDCVVVGGFSKLLKYSKTKLGDLGYTDIITYCDRDWTPSHEDSVYFKNGFTLIHDSGPMLKYYHNKEKKIYPRENFQKYKLEKMFPEIYDKKLTADEILSKKGIYPTYNSGNWKFKMPL